jgi:hypothetical protein
MENQAQHLVFAIDDAILETKRAREGFMIFLQFLREALQEASNNILTDQTLQTR